MTASWPDTSRGPCPTVMLRHDLPGDSEDELWHVDWLLAREPEAASPLMSFRLERPLHELPVGAAMFAMRIHDHRTTYLTYEGPIPGNRGTVARIAGGLILAVHSGESGQVELDLRWRTAGDSTEEMTVALLPEANSGDCQVKLLAITPSSRYK